MRRFPALSGSPTGTERSVTRPIGRSGMLSVAGARMPSGDRPDAPAFHKMYFQGSLVICLAHVAPTGLIRRPLRRLRFAVGARPLSLLAGIALAVLSGAPACAVTTTNSFTVKANLIAACTSVTSPTLDFGPISSVGLPAQFFSGSTTFTVTCGNGLAYKVGLGPGGNYSGSRHIGTAFQGGPLPYQLYQDPGYGTAWGDGTAATAMAAVKIGTGNGSAQTLTIYGKILPGTALPPPGTTLTDSVTITVSY
jgi:spore coat protein U-like protein